MLKRYAFDLDAYEAGVIMGMLWHRPQNEPTRVHLEHRLSELVLQIYREEGSGPGAAAVDILVDGMISEPGALEAEIDREGEKIDRALRGEP